ncbi:MAG TPA: hypothetical protein VK742_17995 [Candidatus Sulfotelmatobacter sp.]|jgi:hypothetical protein|nr:hypothetical protein [Candidatus Sulfotelmatobacter sp.]
MGATTWDYFVPYDDDVGGALQRLRELVFREGRYERFTCSADELKPFQEVPGIVDQTAPLEKQVQKQEGESILQWGVRIQKLLDQFGGESPKAEPDYSKTPKTIDELLEEQGESGTHSILDIQRISPVPEFGAVSPMPAERLSEIFGTDKPTRKMVESKLGDCREAHDLVENPLVTERWQGVYFILYRDGKPAELFFMGTSGD